MVVATTHFDALKTYASTTEGVASAGFGFNPETFAPTYRLHYGSPGSSLALEIATRLGLPAAIIDAGAGAADRARGAARRAPGAGRARACRRSSTSTGWSRASARWSRRRRRKLQGREQELRDREETFRKRLDQKIEERLRDARREIDAVVDALKAQARAADAERGRRLVSTGDIGAARADARSALEAIEAQGPRDGRAVRPRRPSGAPAKPRGRLATGSRSGRSGSKASCSRSTTATPKSTSAASGCARGSTSCA